MHRKTISPSEASSRNSYRWFRMVAWLILLVMLLNPAAGLKASASSNPQSSSRPAYSPAAQGIASLPRPLDFESRVICRQAIEEVYWNHRIWPAENQQPKPELTQVLPSSALRARVEDELRRSNALEQLWQRPITGAQLQAEVDRMLASTRQPAVLAEVIAVLGGDPYLVAECLARPALSERLLRNWFDSGQVSDQGFDQWWQAESSRFSTKVGSLDYPYQLAGLSQVFEQDDTWTPTPALPEGNFGSTAVWTGSEMIIFGGVGAGSGGRTNSGSRYNPATDTWTTVAAIGAPEPRAWHTAVWTGSEMIVWGGCNQSSSFCTTNSGGRYDPLTDSWTATTFTGAPTDRQNHTAVWTGSQMIVWGGCSIGPEGNNYCNILLNDGGSYDPSSDSWASLSTAAAPSARDLHKAVFTDGVMVVWGGHDGISVVNSGGRYNPDTNSWQPTSTAGAPAGRANHTLVSTGSEAIVWGGCNNSLCTPAETYYNSGARYDPATNTWTATTLSGAPSVRANHSAVWTGTEMIIWGGHVSGANKDTGGRYDPIADAWTDTSIAGAPAGRSSHHAVWTGAEMIVWGGASSAGQGRSGGRYDPLSDSWVPTSTNDPVFAKERHTAVWTGTEMLVWGGSTLGYGEYFGFGIRFDGVTGSWSLMSTANEPQGRFFHTAVWTGTEMIVWGGQYGTSVFDTGGRYNPLTDSWTDTSIAGAPDGRAYHMAVWSGSEMLVWGGSTYTEFFTNTGGRYNPSTDSWSTIPTAGAPTPRAHLRGVWSGSEMIVWGGYSATGDTNTGGRYDPATNSWTATSTTGAPAGRHFNTAIWTGSEMIVWGGMSGTLDDGTWYNTGGRYDPVSDTWVATATSGAPSPRIWHVDVWTGEELIVWGGCTGSTSCPDEVYTGGRYDPGTDTWTETSLQSAPSQRSNASAVWTGADMIVWGGFAGNVGTYTATGGFYHTSTVSNTPPIAQPDSYSTDEDIPLVELAPGVLENDEDADGNPLTAILVSGPISGSLDLASDGAFVYTPDQDFNGSDSFSYRAFDGVAYSDIAVVSLSIRSINDAPLAADDSTSTPEDIPVLIHVLENDSDVDSPALLITEVGDPLMGTAVISGDSVLYTPAANLHGSDTFTYTVSDGLLQDTALVMVDILPVNDAPQAVADTYTISQGTELVIPAPGVLVNDSDVDGDELTASPVAEPQYGSLQLGLDGSFIYIPDIGYYGTDQFTYQASDGSAASEETIVSITIGALPPPGLEMRVYLPMIKK